MLTPCRHAVVHDRVYGDLPLTPGQSLVSEDSELIAAYPDLWVAAESPRRGGLRTISSGDEPVRPQISNPWATPTGPVALVCDRREIAPWRIVGGSPTISLRPRQPVGRIRFTPSVLDTIAREIADDPTRETGGLMSGRGDRDLIDCIYASGPGDGAQRSSTRLTLDAHHLRTERQAAEARGESLAAIWHTHPGPHPDNWMPSARDLDVLSAARGDESSIGVVIVTPSDAEDGCWSLSAWRLTAISCAPLTIYGVEND